MDLHQNTIARANLIKSITAKNIIINDRSYSHSLIITKDSLIEIDINSVADLTMSHINALLACQPDVILLGSGVKHEFPAVELLNPIASKNAGFEVMNNQSASRTYNVLVAEERKVACLLIL